MTSDLDGRLTKPSLVVLFDTSVGSGNIGDQIIMDAVRLTVRELYPRAMVIPVPTTLPLGKNGKKLLRAADMAFVGGTNLLSSHMLRYRQWKISPLDVAFMKNVVLLGVGWWQYQQSPDLYTRTMLKRALSSKHTHAVRDQYTVANLQKSGIPKVVNTGCPTLWHVDNEAVQKAVREPVDRVITTVTDYHPNIERDNAMLDALRKRYSSRAIWLQGIGDYNYIKSLKIDGFEIIDPTLKAFNDALSVPTEYVGMRLHAGIRALQYGRYSRIVPIDNRAKEMAKDFGLPIISDFSDASMETHFGPGRSITLSLPHDTIAAWKSQFAV